MMMSIFIATISSLAGENKKCDIDEQKIEYP